MPLLKITTNGAVSDSSELMRKASQKTAALLQKPEDFMMVILETDKEIIFGQSTAPAAYCELKGLGLGSEKTTELAQALCSLLEEECHLDPARVYIVFEDIDRPMWGWNKQTFAAKK